MRQNHSASDKKVYIFNMEIENYQFIAQTSGERYSMSLLINRIIQHAREKGEDFVIELLGGPR